MPGLYVKALSNVPRQALGIEVGWKQGSYIISHSPIPISTRGKGCPKLMYVDMPLRGFPRRCQLNLQVDMALSPLDVFPNFPYRFRWDSRLRDRVIEIELLKGVDLSFHVIHVFVCLPLLESASRDCDKIRQGSRGLPPGIRYGKILIPILGIHTRFPTMSEKRQEDVVYICTVPKTGTCRVVSAMINPL